MGKYCLPTYFFHPLISWKMGVAFVDSTTA